MEADARVCYDRQVPCVVGNTVLLIIENPWRLEMMIRLVYVYVCSRGSMCFELVLSLV